MPAFTATTNEPILAFTGQQVERLTGLTQRQLRYWETSGVFRATYVDERPHRPYRRIYSYRDLVSLRALALFRNRFRISLEELRRVGTYLAQFDEAPWASLQIRVTNDRHLVFRDPASGEWASGSRFGQGVMETILLEDVHRDTLPLQQQLRERNPADVGKITRHRHIAHNAWIIAGTRVPTRAIWSFHEAGYTPEEILRQYPHVTLIDILKAIEHENALREAA
jgi:uncharacterized protein (DUF433 family)